APSRSRVGGQDDTGRTAVGGGAGAEGENRRRQPVHVVATTNRPDLTRGEEARDAVDAEPLTNHGDVVVCGGEQLRTPAVAGEQQRALDGVEARGPTEPLER